METDGRKITASRLQRALVKALAPHDEADEILGDLSEEATQIAAAEGARAGRRWLRWQIAHSAGPWIRRRARDMSGRTRRAAATLHRGWWSDIRFAGRRLGQSRGFTVLAVLTLAIGIGSVSIVLSFAHGLWLKPLPYHDPDRLVWIQARHESADTFASLTPAELAEHQRDSQSLSGVAGFVYGAGIARDDKEPVRIVAHRGSPNLFRVLGVRPVIGRDFTDTDARGARVVIISHGTWTRRFGRDRAIVGKTLTLDGARYDIVGVMPQGFTFPRVLEGEVWIRLDLTRAELQGRRIVEAVARLAPGRTLADAAAEADIKSRRLAAVFPETNKRWGAAVSPAGQTTSRANRLALQALLAIVGLFLMIASTNLAGLLLARNAARRAEFAVCLSLGASHWRLARMLLVESAILAAAGCAAGILLAWYASPVLSRFMPPRMPGLDDVGVNAVVMVVTAAVGLMSALLVGLLPALSLRSMQLTEALAASRTVVRGMARSQRALVVVEIALAVVLVVSAGVMLRAFLNVLERPRGYEPRGLLALNVSLPFSDDSYLATETRARWFDQMIEHVAAVAGVRSVAATTGFPGSPLGVLGGASITLPGGTAQLVASVHACSPRYFDTMGIPIKAGRSFSESDSTHAPGVAIVNELLAREFPGANPVGHRIPLSIQGEKKLFEIVGVAGNIRLSERIGHRVFVPLAQASPYWVDLVVRADGRGRVMPAIRQVLRGLNSELLIENESSLQTIISDSLALERAQSAGAIMIASLSTIVAGVGLYALMTFMAAQRRREFGIRLALGSLPHRLFSDMVLSALRLAAMGIGLGVIASTTLVRLLGTRVFGLTSADVTAYVSASVLVLVVALAAVWIPARRVMRTDPLIALRTD